MKILIVAESNYGYTKLKISDIELDSVERIKQLANLIRNYKKWFNWDWDGNRGGAYALYVDSKLFTESDYWFFANLVPPDEHRISTIIGIHLIDNMETLL